jgi:hypothetical protein
LKKKRIGIYCAKQVFAGKRDFVVKNYCRNLFEVASKHLFEMGLCFRGVKPSIV